MIVATCGVFFNIFLFFTLHGGLPICRLPHGGGGHQHLGGDHHGHSHGGGEGGQVNIRAALFHVLTDFLQSIGVLVSSILIHFKPSWKLADPLCTLVFGIFALISTLPTIWKLLRTLLESTPDNLCYDEVHETLSKVIRQPSRAVCVVYLMIDKQVRGVVGVHSLHLW